MTRMEQIYNLQLTERQARILSYACNMYSRLIEGQDFAYQELFELAWEKRCKKETGECMSESWDGGWQAMRQDAEEICMTIKRRFWGLEANALYGVRYDDTSDILFDLHQCIRHQLWLDGDRKYHGVDSDTPMQFGSEPLAEISRIENK